MLWLKSYLLLCAKKIVERSSLMCYRMCYSSFLQRYGLIIRNVPPSTRSCPDSESDENLLDMVFKSQYDLMDSPRRTPTPKKRLRRRAGMSNLILNVTYNSDFLPSNCKKLPIIQIRQFLLYYPNRTILL